MIERLLSPSRVAVIGSLSKETGLGARTVRHLSEAGYPGEIVPARDPREIDGEVDVAVVAVPAAAVPGVVSGLAGRAAYVIVYSSGFDETGDTATLYAAGSRILGPNTVGLHYAPSRTMLTFAKAFDDMTDCRSGSGVFLISQSGAFGARLLRAARRHGVDYDGFIGTGNEHDHSAVELAAELVASVTHRPRTLALYLEGVRDVPALDRMLGQARAAGVRVVVLLGGESESGAGAARSHTAAVSPDHEVLTELCLMHGALVVRSDRELVDATVALSVLPPARGPRVGVITGSGGAGVVAADLLAERGLALRPLGDATKRALQDLLPPYASVTNPVDVTAQVIGDTGAVARVRAALVGSGEVDAVLVIGRAEQAAAVAGDHGVPVVLAVLDGDASSVAGYVRSGQPVLPTLEAACNAVRALTVGGADKPTTADDLVPDGSAQPYRTEDTASSVRFLDAAGVRVAAWRECRDSDAAVAAGGELGWPVVVKANLATIAHKAAQGGVRLDVGPDDIAAVARELLAIAPSVIVAEQLRAGPELFVGIRRDPQLGLVTAAGLGGGHIELIGRTVTVPAGAPPEWLAERLRAVVFGNAGARYAHLPELLAETAATLTDLAVRHGLSLVECNPLVEVDSRLIALDARVVSA
ncbi:acetate--CoA ligase family protein [Amycolatopsis sp. K13G38]|uniref:Acetate--CoA ligase family protein n=1 Tax=Amycolatopsis acididurans TaxID=2724524 RepID=A0ABX1IY35_9PSEU|nr:acetate--CoA ligase family protein [Amycolatopsis acididurans]NKQ52416.1 acetate--CoA ligase family protein [Amycolatopsis acididurans]